MVVMIVVASLIFAMIMAKHQAKERERRDRMRLLEEAMRNNNLDPQLRHQLLANLSQPMAQSQGWFQDPGRMVFSIAWLGLFVGIGLIVAANVYFYDRDMVVTGTIIAIISFALITLPMAIREFESRRRV